MAQPTPYVRQFDFEQFSTDSPSDQQPGVQFEAEFDAIKATLDDVLTNLALIQRDDGDIANASVGTDQLEPSLSIGINTAADWMTATAYGVNDAVYESNKLYRCVTAHTSGTFATDLASGYWSEIVDFSAFTAAASASADAAAASAAAASASETNAASSASAASTSASNASTSASNASTSETNAAASAAAAAASAASLAFPAIVGGDALKYVRINAAEDAYEYITPPTIPTAAIASELDTGTDTAKFVTADALAGSDYGLLTVALWATAPDGDAATGTGLNYYDVFSNMDGFVLQSVSAKCVTAGVTGTMTLDVNLNGTSVFTLNNELDVASGATTDNGTAAINGTQTLSTGDVLSVDMDAVHSGTAAVGVRVLLTFRKP